MKKIITIIFFLVTAVALCFSAEKAPDKSLMSAETQAMIVSPASKPVKPKVEAVFLLDTTGSMSRLIDAAKKKIWSIANTLATGEPTPDISIGLIPYRDKGDQYVTKIINLTNDLDLIYSQLLDFKADGGGDEPESVNQALNEAVTKIKWSQDKNVFKVIYLVGDSPPHMDYQEDIKYPETCKKAAEQGIFINTIQCGNNSRTVPIWQDVALKAEGMYFAVEQSGNAILASTPYDEELAKLAIELDKTRIFYGSQAEREEQSKRMMNSEKIYKEASLSAQAGRAAFNSGISGATNFLGKKELVDDIENGRVTLKEIKPDEMNEKMKDMTLEQQRSYLEQMSAKRKEIQKKIEELSDKRQQFIKDQIKKENLDSKPTLDSALYKSIQSQGAGRGGGMSGGSMGGMGGGMSYSRGPVY